MIPGQGVMEGGVLGGDAGWSGAGLSAEAIGGIAPNPLCGKYRNYLPHNCVDCLGCSGGSGSFLKYGARTGGRGGQVSSLLTRFRISGYQQDHGNKKASRLPFYRRDFC